MFNRNRIKSFSLLLGIFTVIAMILSISGCSSAKDSKATVVTSFYPLEFIVEEISGSDFEVINVTPLGAEPHDLELTPKTTGELIDADLAIVLGKGFQPAVEKTAKSRNGKTLEVLDALANQASGVNYTSASAVRPLHDGVDHDNEQDAKAHEESGKKLDANDPHVWLDPKEMATVVSVVTDELVKIKPEKKNEYLSKKVELIAKLSKLDAKYKEQLSACEIDTFVSSHDAFSRLAYRYDLNQESIAGLSPENEPTPAKLKEISELVKEKDIKYIFTEELVSKKVADTISSQAGIETKVLSPIEGLTQEQKDGGETYFTLMETNLSLLSTALRCSPAA